MEPIRFKTFQFGLANIFALTTIVAIALSHPGRRLLALVAETAPFALSLGMIAATFYGCIFASWCLEKLLVALWKRI